MNKSLSSLLDHPTFNFVSYLFSLPYQEGLSCSIDFTKDRFLFQVLNGCINSFVLNAHPNFQNQISHELSEDDISTIIEMNLLMSETYLLSETLRLVNTNEPLGEMTRLIYSLKSANSETRVEVLQRGCFIINPVMLEHLGKTYSNSRNLDDLLKLYKILMEKDPFPND